MLASYQAQLLAEKSSSSSSSSVAVAASSATGINLTSAIAVSLSSISSSNITKASLQSDFDAVEASLDADSSASSNSVNALTSDFDAIANSLNANSFSSDSDKPSSSSFYLGTSVNMGSDKTPTYHYQKFLSLNQKGHTLKLKHHVYEYKTFNLSGHRYHKLAKNSHVKVAHLVRRHGVERIKLSNGHYITANRHVFKK